MKYKPPLRPMPQVSVNRPSVQGSRGSQWATKSGSERYHLPPEEAELREREWYLQNEARKLGLSVKSSIKSGPVSSRGTYVRESISPLQIEKANECAADIARAVSSAFEMPLNSSRFGEQFAKASNSFSQLSELYKSNKEHVKRRGQQDMDERLYQFGTRLHNAGYWGPRLIGKAERAAREQSSIWSRILSSFSSTQPGTDVVSECPSVEPSESGKFHYKRNNLIGNSTRVCSWRLLSH